MAATTTELSVGSISFSPTNADNPKNTIIIDSKINLIILFSL